MVCALVVSSTAVSSRRAIELSVSRAHRAVSSDDFLRRGADDVQTYLSGRDVVGVGVVDRRRAHLVQLLAVPGDGFGQVDDVKGLGAPMWVICTARAQVRLGAAASRLRRMEDRGRGSGFLRARMAVSPGVATRRGAGEP
jgi:hypothetical protein